MLGWLARKVTGRKEGSSPAEAFVIEVVRSSGIRKGIAGLGGFSSGYSPGVGFYAAVCALADYANSFLGEGKEVTGLIAAIIPKLFSNEQAGLAALRGAAANMEPREFMDLVLEIQERAQQAHERYAGGPAGIEHLIDQMSFVQEYL